MTTVIDALGAGVAPATEASVRELVAACSPATLQKRFFLPFPFAPDRVFAQYRRYLLAGPPGDVALVAWRDGAPVGLLNLGLVGDHRVEAGLLVADAWQRRHVATCLLAELGAPRWAGWTVLATVQPTNREVLALLRGQHLGSVTVLGRDPSAWDFAITLPTATRSGTGCRARARGADRGCAAPMPRSGGR